MALSFMKSMRLNITALRLSPRSHFVSQIQCFCAFHAQQGHILTP